MEVVSIKKPQEQLKPVMYKPKQVAQIFDCSDVHIKNLCKKGEIPHLKLGKEYRIPIAFVEDTINELQTQKISK